MATTLATNFPRITLVPDGAGRVARRMHLIWWEDAPGARSKIPEVKLPEAERTRRAAEWRHLVNLGPAAIPLRVQAHRN